MLKVVHDEAEPNEASGSVLDEIVREAARQMLAVALQAEVSAYIDAHAEEVDENGHRLVVRNGHHNEREVITAAGPVPVRAPRVNDKRLHVSSPALPSDRAEVSPNLRVLMFASAAGDDALKQDDTGHWGRG